jgi:methyl-accepting chemotaxis protein
MKIRAKLLFRFSVVALIGLVIGITGYVSINLFVGQMYRLHETQEEGGAITEVLNAHFEWRQDLTDAVMANKEFTGSLDPAGCAFGKWRASDAAQNIDDPTMLSLIDKVTEPHNYIHNQAKVAVNLMQQGELEQARSMVADDIIPKAKEVIDLLTELEAYCISGTADLVDEAEQYGSTLSVVIIIITALAMVASVFLAFNTADGIVKPIRTISGFMKQAGETGNISLRPEDVVNIQKLSSAKDEIGELSCGAAGFVQHISKIAEQLEAVAHGDLTVRADLLSDKDTMGISLKDTMESLSEMFREIDVSTKEVSNGSRQIAEGSQTLAQGSTEQASSVQELSATISEIADKTKENAGMANKAAALANTIKSSAEKGSQQMNNMLGAVNEINQASQSISKVIKVIDDIAFQTNILALNAAVEAARAGQHGKGFAVVAEEVRNLAAKSAEAAKETSDMIQNSMEKAELGARIASETSSSLTEIVAGINESSQLIAEIASSSEHQSMGIAQINTGIDQVAQVIQQNSATAEQSAAASQQMSGQASVLEGLVARFKLKDENKSGR